MAFTVPVFVPIEPVLGLSPATCSNTCDGSATVSSVAGGFAPYSYFWEPAPVNGQGDSLATGLCPGSYQVTVGDANGCDTTLTFVITAPAPIDPVATITPIGCGGQCTGAIALAPQGGSGGFTYTWSPAPPQGQGTATASQLCAGDWTVVIADANGCDTTVTFTLLQPLPIDARADVTPSHCGVCDGAAQLHVSGGMRLDTLSGVGDGIIKFNNAGDLSGLSQTNNIADVLRGNGTWGSAVGTLPFGALVGTYIYGLLKDKLPH